MTYNRMRRIEAVAALGRGDALMILSRIARNWGLASSRYHSWNSEEEGFRTEEEQGRRSHDDGFF